MITPKQLLERITLPGFEATVVAATPSILRKMLLRRQETADLRRMYDSGSLTDELVGRFVDELLQQNMHAHRFPYQTALAVLAVVFEDRFSSFAKEYISDLARIRSGRFSVAAAVARECLAARRTQSENKLKRVSLCSMVTACQPAIDRQVLLSENQRGLAAA